MDPKGAATVRAYHSERISRFGVASAKSLGWRDEHAQSQRFKQISEIGNLNGKTMLDIGCGHGDLFSFISKIYPRLIYCGLDQEEAFLKVAFKRYGGKSNTKFFLGDFNSVSLPKYDYVVCSGGLNYRTSDNRHVFKMISKFFKASRLGVGLNILKSVDFENGILVPYSESQIMKYCKKLTSKLVLKESDNQNHFTLFLYQ
tara:strand:- start:1541 stop:2143 length:603 start_codon:yes stop_codon:yes gene_type:complete